MSCRSLSSTPLDGDRLVSLGYLISWTHAEGAVERKGVDGMRGGGEEDVDCVILVIKRKNGVYGY